jgi:CheY-like chemotaxis protein
MVLLHVDDDPDDVETFREVALNINPDIMLFDVSNGVEALKLLDDAVVLPDYIFLDINMPVMDGKDCLLEIKKDKRFASIPVIMYTTSDKKQDITYFKEIGATYYLVKPNSYKQAYEDLTPFLKPIASL